MSAKWFDMTENEQCLDYMQSVPPATLLGGLSKQQLQLHMGHVNPSHNSQIQSLLMEHQQEVESLNTLHESTLSQCLSQLKIQMTAKHEEEMVEAREPFERELSEKLYQREVSNSDMLQQQLRDAEEAWERRTEELKEEVQRETVAQHKVENQQLDCQSSGEDENAHRASEQAKIADLERERTRELTELKKSALPQNHNEQLDMLNPHDFQQQEEVRSQAVEHSNSLQEHVKKLEELLLSEKTRTMLQQMVREEEDWQSHSYMEKEQAIQQLQEQHIDSLAELLVSNTLCSTVSLEQQRAEMLKEKEIALASLRTLLNQQHSSTLTSIQQEHQQLLSALHKEYQAKMSELENRLLKEQENQLALLEQSLRDELVKEKETLQALLESEHHKQMEELIQTCTAEKETALVALQHELQAKEEQQICDLQERHNKALEALAHKMENEKREAVEQVTNERDQEWNRDMQKQTRELQAIHEKTMAELVGTHLQALETVKQDMNASLASQASEHAKKLATLEREHSNRETLLKEEFQRLRQADQSTMESAVMEELTRVNHDLQKRLAQLEKQHQEQRETAQDSAQLIQVSGMVSITWLGP